MGTVGPAQTLTCPNSLCTCPQSPLLWRVDQSQLWEYSLSIQVFHRRRIYQANLGDLNHGLCNCTERFPFLLLSRTTPRAQLWFWPHLCVCATLRHLFLVQARGRESSGCLGHTYSLRLGRGMAATMKVSVSCLRRWGPAGSWNKLWRAHSGGSPSQCLRRQELACGGSGGPAPHAPLKNGASLSR